MKSTRNTVLICLFAAAITLAATPAGAPAQSGATALFAHVATGHDPNAGDYATTFTLLNTGSETLNGKLILTYHDGTPLTAAIAGPEGFQAMASSVDISIPIGGTQFWTATGISPADSVKTGWARVDSTGGTLGGVATFQLTAGNYLTAIAGVLPSSTTQYATIPVDNDGTRSRFTGYALANPGSDTINVALTVVGQDGRVVAPGVKTITLKAGEQRAAFLHEDAASLLTFQGTVVMIEQNGKKFAVVALVQNQGLLTAIPVIPEKAPAVN